ncbi:hypothetical protein E6O75_ATG08941 [Venturia nashicola]|uniref:Rhodopsin domain-containing protein n=1 Tax=Venturia nashicola TaxID=86259 RepID=A0A4Z1NM26_9PEZI|nr:hypothetical protein E6O75_ATG08941 [Venturia nashicola]
MVNDFEHGTLLQSALACALSWLCQRGYTVSASCWVDWPGMPFIIIALVSMLHRPNQRFQWILTIPPVCGIATSTGMALLTAVGLGVHDVSGSISSQDRYQWGLMATNCVYLSCNAFVKLGLLEMYRHFTMLWYNQWWTSTVQVLSIIFGLSGVLGVIFQCVPVTSAWDHSIVGACHGKKFQCFHD